MRVVTTVLRGVPIEPGHEVDVLVPGYKPRFGIYRGHTKAGLIYVQLWSPRLGRYSLGLTRYAPAFVHHRRSFIELMDMYAASP